MTRPQRIMPIKSRKIRIIIFVIFRSCLNCNKFILKRVDKTDFKTYNGNRKGKTSTVVPNEKLIKITA